jgi:riboflavin kinase/FMN adenylyltransferase
MSGPLARSGAVITVGTFDGVHRGHWELLQTVVRRAEALHRPSVLVTFDPHPLRIVRPDAAPPLLTTPVEKMEILAESGLTYAAFLRFDRRLSAYEPRRFVEEILIGRFGLGQLVIGHDHGFGRGRSGDVATLRALGTELGFSVEVVAPVQAAGGPISSTRIRRALAEGDVLAAAAGLGRAYTLRGTVVRGDGRGRELGFPTANIEVPDPAKLLPAEGIYAVRAVLRTGAVDGVLHLGPRPTFPGATPTVEVFLLDWTGDLYGRQIRIDVCARLRDVVRFDDVDALVAAMHADVEAARRLFATGAGACGIRPLPLP